MCFFFFSHLRFPCSFSMNLFLCPYSAATSSFLPLYQIYVVVFLCLCCPRRMSPPASTPASTTLYFHAPWPNLSPLLSFCDSKASCTLWSFTFCLQNMKVVSLLWENFSCIFFSDSLKFQCHFGQNVFKWFLPKADHQCRKFNPK